MIPKLAAELDELRERAQDPRFLEGESLDKTADVL